MPKTLRNAALWVRDWVMAAVHDPEFWSYRIATIRLIPIRYQRWPKFLEFRIYPPRPVFRLHHPRDWSGWGIPLSDKRFDDIPF